MFAELSVQYIKETPDGIRRPVTDLSYLEDKGKQGFRHIIVETRLVIYASPH